MNPVGTIHLWLNCISVNLIALGIMLITYFCYLVDFAPFIECIAHRCAHLTEIQLCVFFSRSSFSYVLSDVSFPGA